MSVGPPREADGEWPEFVEALERATGMPLRHYKEPQLRRRLGTLMTRRGFASWDDFARGIARDGKLLAVVRDALTINVSEFFRQPDRFAELQSTVLPRLMAARPRLKIWSAGCSIGCEPYTIAMILSEIDPGGEHRIIATDVDMRALSRAREGCGYLPHEVRAVPPVLLARYFVEERGTYRVIDDLRRKVTFRRHDLLSDRYPERVDLILCRNVVIYLTDDAKRHVFAGFAQSLRPGGVLFVGGSEMIMRAGDMGLRGTSTSLYERAA